jgi:hypothetical protein
LQLPKFFRSFYLFDIFILFGSYYGFLLPTDHHRDSQLIHYFIQWRNWKEEGIRQRSLLIPQPSLSMLSKSHSSLSVAKPFTQSQRNSMIHKIGRNKGWEGSPSRGRLSSALNTSNSEQYNFSTISRKPQVPCLSPYQVKPPGEQTENHALISTTYRSSVIADAIAESDAVNFRRVLSQWKLFAKRAKIYFLRDTAESDIVNNRRAFGRWSIFARQARIYYSKRDFECGERVSPSHHTTNFSQGQVLAGGDIMVLSSRQSKAMLAVRFQSGCQIVGAKAVLGINGADPDSDILSKNKPVRSLIQKEISFIYISVKLSSSCLAMKTVIVQYGAGGLISNREVPHGHDIVTYNPVDNVSTDLEQADRSSGRAAALLAIYTLRWIRRTRRIINLKKIAFKIRQDSAKHTLTTMWLLWKIEYRSAHYGHYTVQKGALGCFQSFSIMRCEVRMLAEKAAQFVLCNSFLKMNFISKHFAKTRLIRLHSFITSLNKGSTANIIRTMLSTCSRLTEIKRRYHSLTVHGNERLVGREAIRYKRISDKFLQACEISLFQAVLMSERRLLRRWNKAARIRAGNRQVVQGAEQRMVSCVLPWLGRLSRLRTGWRGVRRNRRLIILQQWKAAILRRRKERSILKALLTCWKSHRRQCLSLRMLTSFSLRKCREAWQVWIAECDRVNGIGQVCTLVSRPHRQRQVWSVIKTILLVLKFSVINDQRRAFKLLFNVFKQRQYVNAALQRLYLKRIKRNIERKCRERIVLRALQVRSILARGLCVLMAGVKSLVRRVSTRRLHLRSRGVLNMLSAEASQCARCSRYSLL